MDADKRRAKAKDVLADPSVVDAYPHRFLIVQDSVNTPRVLEAVEALEERGWGLVNMLDQSTALLRRA